jgi:hypothetical protein
MKFLPQSIHTVNRLTSRTIMATTEQIAYGGWQHCTRISDGRMEVVVTNEVGPRVIRCGMVDGKNLFGEIADDMGSVGGDVFRLYGGHRLWHAPEHLQRTYFPDNVPVSIEPIPNGARFIAPPEHNGLQKTIEITLDNGSARLTHRLTNTSVWAITCAPWAVSVMAAGGMAIMPVPPRGSHATQLMPSHALTLWAYTDMADARWTWGREFILLRQDRDALFPQKIGIGCPQLWLAYVNDGMMFTKRSAHPLNGVYPDMNSCLEVFTDAAILELETLAPLTTLEPDASVEHVEYWRIYGNVPMPESEADVKNQIMPRLADFIVRDRGA